MSSHPVDSEVLQALQTLQKYNFKEAELALKKEAGLTDSGIAEEFLEFKAETPDDPKTFISAYEQLIRFIDTAADQHKLELSSLLYPVFVQLYMRLVSGNFCTEAKFFMERFRRFQEDYYQEDIKLLASISEPDHLFTNPLVESFRATDFYVSIASASYVLLRRYIREHKLSVLQSVLKDQLHIETIDGPPRSKLQLHSRRGAIFGEARKDANTEPVLYGLLRDSSTSLDSSEPTKSSPNDNMDSCDADAESTPSKKKKKKEGSFPGQKPSKSCPDDPKGAYAKSPAIDRVPLPKLSKTYLDRRRFLRREISSLRRSALQQDSDPGTTAIFYTVCNAQAGESALAIRRGGVPSMSFSEDLSLLAVGFGSGRIRVWSLGAESLRQMMPPDELALLDMDDDRIRSKMLHDENDETHPARDLLGHQSAVHGVAFSPDGQLVASASADGSLRLWSTVLWGGTLTAWRDHVMPIWCVAWPPAYGHYLATGGSDRTARLYACDHAPGPLRVFCGHQADVTAVSFHPNVNYLATGSADRAVRLFDIRSGKAVRLFTGHKGSVQSLAFSPCGRYLASGGWCGATCLWDIGRGSQVGQLGGYSALTASTPDDSEDCSSRQLLTGPVVALHFCPSGSGQLAAAGLEGAVRVWNTGTGQLVSQQTPLEGGKTASTANTDSSSSSAKSANNGGGGLLAAHNALSDVYQRNANRSGREWRQTAETYYSAAGSYEVSRTCLRDAFFTRKTSVLAVQFAHPYMLLAAGPYNQA